MKTEELLNEYFYLFKLKHIKGIPIKVIGKPDENVFSIMNENILGRFGLPINNGYEDILLDFVNNEVIHQGLIESVVGELGRKGREYKEMVHYNQYSFFLKYQNLKKEIVVDELREYVFSHLEFTLTKKDFEDIETGFRIRWNHSTGQIVGDGDFKRSVEFYLTSIENPMNREKMNQVVDKILEYFEIIGQWGEDEE
jgi:hypothetical protein